MADTNTSDTFAHLMQSALKSLQIHILRGPEELEEIQVTPNVVRPVLTPTQSALQQHERRNVLDPILADISGMSAPEAIFRRALVGLRDVEQERFLIENMLEAVKRGDSLDKIVGDYRKVGLTTAVVPGKEIKSTSDNVPGSVGDGKFLTLLQRQLKKIALDLMHLASIAIKAAARFVSVRPSVGFVGMVPSLGFEIEANMPLAELFDILSESM